MYLLHRNQSIDLQSWFFSERDIDRERVKTFTTFLIIFCTFPFLDLKRVVSFPILLAENFLLQNLATSDSRLNFEKSRSVSKLLVGKPARRNSSIAFYFRALEMLTRCYERRVAYKQILCSLLSLQVSLGVLELVQNSHHFDHFAPPQC